MSMHFKVSLVKSLVRFGAGTALAFQSFWLAGCLIILAECLGIVEEIFE